MFNWPRHTSVCSVNLLSHSIQFFHLSRPVNLFGVPSGQRSLAHASGETSASAA